MPIHPDAQAFLDQRASQGSRNVEDLTVQEAREQSARFNASLPRQDVTRVREIQVPGLYGEIPVRLYYPGEQSQYPILIFFHGGGFVIGNLEITDAVCRQWTNGTGCLVASVNYRHAPEHKFPAAAEDAYSATRWLYENATELGGDPRRLAVSGISAGGGLAATTSLMARDRSGPPLAFQLLWVPVVNYDFETNSYHENATGYGLTRAGMQWFWNHYLANPSHGANPYASPLRAPDLSNLPPAFVLTAQYDPLRDEGCAYAERLRAAGVPVELRTYEGMIHGFLGTQAAQDAFDTIRGALGVG